MEYRHMENERGCYCGLWQTNPATLTEQGVPPGFCGICERCGQPGHTRHFPGPVPVTGSWCDRCYGIVAWQGRALRLAIPAAVLIIAVIYLLLR